MRIEKRSAAGHSRRVVLFHEMLDVEQQFDEIEMWLTEKQEVLNEAPPPNFSAQYERVCAAMREARRHMQDRDESTERFQRLRCALLDERNRKPCSELLAEMTTCTPLVNYK